jgi:hypothetical protein
VPSSLFKSLLRKTRSRPRALRGDDFHPLPNKAVRVRIAGAEPFKGFLARLDESNVQEPVAYAESAFPLTPRRLVGLDQVDAQTPATTPRKDFRITELASRVNEIRDALSVAHDMSGVRST